MGIHTAEPLVLEPTLIRVQIATRKLERYKSPITDLIPAELIDACEPLTFPSCTVRKWLSHVSLAFCLSLNFMWKRETRRRLPGAKRQSMEYHTTEPKKEAENTTLPRRENYGNCLLQCRETFFFFFWKGKRSIQLAMSRRSANFVVRFVKNVRRSKLSSFSTTTRGLALHVWPWG
jgi:hypothetical protein